MAGVQEFADRFDLPLFPKAEERVGERRYLYRAVAG
jgi:hypothetical protein